VIRADQILIATQTYVLTTMMGAMLAFNKNAKTAPIKMIVRLKQL
jgi:hypothetical protein